MSLGALEDKWTSFGWEVFPVDGHNVTEILNAFDRAATVIGKPSVLIAKTLKGKGCSFCEGKVEYHGVAPTSEECACALDELGCKCEEK